jgi:hypothetical protein
MLILDEKCVYWLRFDHFSEIQFGMCSIAIRHTCASSALAKIVIFFACGELDGGELGAFVWAVAEGLVLREAACTIVVIFPHLQLYPESITNYCFGHLSTAQGSVIFCFSASVTGCLRSLDWSHPIWIKAIKYLFSDTVILFLILTNS